MNSILSKVSRNPCTMALPPIRKVLIVNKLTKYAYLSRKDQIAKELNPADSPHDVDKLVKADEIHQKYLQQIYWALRENGLTNGSVRQVQTRPCGYEILNPRPTTNRGKFTPDLIIAVGGDGTFLRASHLIHQKYNTEHCPIIGINSNPESSEGRLCVPSDQLPPLCSQNKVSRVISEVLNASTVNCVKRQRIAVQVTTRNPAVFKAKDFYTQLPLITDEDELRANNPENEFITDFLPIFALNDVYIGERASSMVSSSEISYKTSETDHGLRQETWKKHPPQKNSGIVFSTGTGSTGWANSINRVNPEVVKTVLNEMRSRNQLSGEVELEELSEKISAEINQSRTVFNPEEPVMGVTFREPIHNKISSFTSSNFIKATAASLVSKHNHGMIAVDGSTYFSLPTGSRLACRVDDKHSINCIELR